LRVKGEKELAAFLVNEIQQVYRLQGVLINDKHIEVIVRQMLRRVRVKEVGDTSVPRRRAGREARLREGERAGHRARRPPGIAEALLLGITKASALDRVLHLGVVLPGDDQGPHGGGDQRQDRLRCAASRRTSSWGVSSRPAPGSPRTRRLSVLVEGEPLVMPREMPRPRHEEPLVAVNEE
jgi:DNA-directed RNA polymerase subunit beta'